MLKTVRKTHSMTLIKSLVLGAYFVVLGVKADACSVYAPYQHAIMAANYDWTVSGGILFTNARALDKTAFLVTPQKEKKPARWTSRYASLTLSQWGREFPMQGMNEAGLAGVVLNAPASYPTDSAATQTLITEMQWLQYQLDRFATLREMESHIQDFGIQKISAALHFFFCDATTDCGIVEFVNGKAQMHRGARFPLRAITNSSYPASFDAWTRFLKEHGGRSSFPPSELPAGYPSLNRMVRAAYYAKVGSTLDSEALQNLRNLAGTGWTNWHSIFRTSRQQALITPLNSAVTYTIERKDFAHDCRQPAKTRLMNETQITSQWTAYNPKDAAALLALAAKPIGGFSQELQKRMIDYAQTPRCPLTRQTSD